MMRNLHWSARPNSGFTLLETAIAGLLVTLLLSSAILAARSGYGAFRATQNASDVEVRVRRALDRAAIELLGVGSSELQPNPTTDFGTDDVLYRHPAGLAGTAITWGDQNRLAFEYESGEVDNGVDDDGDGLIDEGSLVLTRDVGGTERRIVLCNGVSELYDGETANGADDNGNGVKDEAGFNVHRVGDVLQVRLCLEAMGENGIIVRALETSVRVRN
jgi:hypothetical protein